MNGALGSVGLQPLSGNDFAQAEDRALFESIAAHVAGHDGFDAETLRSEVRPALSQVFDRAWDLAAQLTFVSDEQIEMDALQCSLGLRELRLRRDSEELRSLQEDALLQSDAGAVRQWGQKVADLATQVVGIQKAVVAQSRYRTGHRDQAQG